MADVLVLVLSCVSEGAEPWVAAERPHPFLFHTAETVALARASVARSPEARAMADALLKAADAVRTDDLPPLETAWWDTARTKPWGEIYPEINSHTGEVPREWAGRALACARASLVSGDQTHAGRAREILLGLARYSFEYEHYDVGLNYATWGKGALEAYDILYDSFSPGERERLDAFFQHMGEAIEKNDAYWVAHEPGGPLNNHYAWHKLCLLMLGLFYGNDAMVEGALDGPKGFLDALQSGFRDDGLWLEASLNYQGVQTSPMVWAAVLLDNARHPRQLWDTRTDDGRTLRQGYDALLGILFPDGTLPNIGDCYASRARPGSGMDMELLYAHFRDDTHAWHLARSGRRDPAALLFGIHPLPEAPPPAVPGSRLWPEQGYAMLRQDSGPAYWDGEGWTVFLTYSGAPVHDNADKLSLMLFREGRHWLVDAEARAGVYHAFSAAVQRELNRETLCHNTVLVDRAGQRHPGRRLELVEFSDLPGLHRVTLADPDGLLYPGVRQMRSVLVTDEYVLDVFQLRSDTPRTFAWLTHVDGTVTRETDAGWTPADLPGEGPWKWLVAPESAPVGTSWHTVFEADSRRFRMDLLTDGPARMVRCGFPKDDGPSPETLAMRMLEREGTSAWFVACYRGGEETDRPLALQVLPASLGCIEIRLELGEDSRSHYVPALGDAPCPEVR